MKGTIVGLSLLFIALSIVPAVACNGEYKPPTDRVRPPGRSGTPTGGGKGVPTRPPGGVETPKLSGPETSPSPGSVGREEAISWELVWELVRSAEPAPPPELPAGARERATAALTAAVADESLEVRSWAALALGRSGSSAELMERLAADGELMRSPAMLAASLSKLDEAERTRALEVLASAIADPDAPPVTRLAAIAAAGMCGPKGANLLLKTLGAGASGPTRTACLFALGLSGHPGARDFLVSAVLPSPTDDDPAARALLVYALSRLPGPEAGRDVLKRLRDSAPTVRTAAALSLSDRVRSMPEVRRALVDLAVNGPLRPRSAALVSVVLGGGEEGAKLCRQLISRPSDGQGGLVALAALSLGLSRSVLAGAELVKIAGDRSLDRDLRAAAALGAGLVRARGGAAGLRKTAEKEKDPVVAGYAFVGAMLIDPEVAPAVVRALSNEKTRRGRRLLVQALGHGAGDAVTAELVVRLGDEYEVNREAARSLFRADPEKAVAEMLARLTDAKNPFARRYGAIVFGGALDRTRPTRFAKVVLGAGLDASDPVTELFLYLESDILHGRWTKR